jgi:pimeloyl-ACP methyl ester carboxylesterase
MEEIHLTVGGTKTKLLRGGKGPPLLYLHSAAGETLWLPFHEMLAQHFEVFAPAHPGFDTSEGLEKIDSIEDLAFHTLDFIDAMGWEHVDVAGLSLGGWLAAELATRWPDRLRKMALIDSAGLHVPGAPMAPLWENMRDTEALRRLLFHDPESMLAKMVITPLEETPEPLLLQRLRAAEATARVAWNPYFHNPKLPGRLHRIKTPTLVVWGEHDRLIPLAHGKAFVAGIAGARLEVIPQCGHMPILEAVPQLVELLRGHFAD